MLTAANFEAHVAKLVDPAATPEERRILATEVRDSIEVVHTPDYGAFLRHFFPAFRAVLRHLTEPQNVDGAVHKTRSVVLEVINRLPHNEVLRDRVKDLLPLAMDVLRTDNEENAVTAIHIIFDLHKNFRPDLEPQVQSFLDVVLERYSSFGDAIARSFSGAGAPWPNTIPPSSSSFKVVTECPLVVMFLFQLYPKFMQNNLPQLLPKMVEAIKVTLPPEQARLAPKATFHEFIAAQVKTVSFLCFVLKQFQDRMKPYETSIPRAVVQLLKACPGDAVAIRKELLVATRHILGTSMKVGFYSQIDLLLNEPVLVGTVHSAYETLRPLAYAFLADLIHFVRHDLSLDQLSRIVYLFSTNIHDRSLSFSVQSTSVRLLLNLVEGIVKKEDAEVQARHLLIRIMSTMVAKYGAIASQVPRLLENISELQVRSEDVAKGQALSTDPVVDPLKEFNDCKQLIKTLTLGLKTVVWSAIHTRAQSAASGASQVAGMGSSRNTNLIPAVSGSGGPSPGAGIPSVPAGLHTPVAGVSAHPGQLGVPGQASLPMSGLPSQGGLRSGLLEEECAVLAGLLESAKACFQLYKPNVIKGTPQGYGLPSAQIEVKATGATMNTPESGHALAIAGTASTGSQSVGRSSLVPQGSSVAEEKEIFETFAQIFTFLDVRSFQDVFGLRMPDLFEHIVDNSAALTIPQHFLTHQSISKYFADILLNFLVTNMSELAPQGPVENAVSSGHSQRRAQALLRLFQILFSSVSLFSTNEPVLKPHLSTIVRECLSRASKCEDPSNFLYLLRALFKSLTSGKHELQFEMLYRDFMPLLEPVFDGFLALYNGPQRLSHGDLIVELCLTVPARPSTVFPFLSKQLKPMVWALQGGRENVHMGLRQIEFWVDTLQPSYLEQLLCGVEPELTQALHRHTRPGLNRPFGVLALRIIGKLGSRARGALADSSVGDSLPAAESALRMHLAWTHEKPLILEVDDVIRLSSAALTDERDPQAGPVSLEHKIHAWKFMRSALLPFLAIDDFDAESLALLESRDLKVGHAKNRVYGLEIDDLKRGSLRPLIAAGYPIPHRSRATHQAEVATLHTLLVALLSAGGNQELNNALSTDASPASIQVSPKQFALGVCRYFALLHICGFGGCARRREAVDLDSLRQTTEVSPPELLDPDIFVDALIDVMSREKRSHAMAGLACLVEFVDGLLEYSGLQKMAQLASARTSLGGGKSEAEGAPGMRQLDRESGIGINAQDAAVGSQSKQVGGSENENVASGALEGRQDKSGLPQLPGAGADNVNRHPQVPGEVESMAVDSMKRSDERVAKTGLMDADAIETSVSGAEGTMQMELDSDSGVGVNSVSAHAADKAMAAEMETGEHSRIRSSGSEDPASLEIPPAISALVERLCHCCYQRSWHAKWAGAAGFGVVIDRVPAEVFQVRASGSYEAHVVRALMFVVRDLPGDVSVLTGGVARSSLRSLLELCHRGDVFDGDENDRDRALRDVTVCIAVELTSESSEARDAAKEALRTLAAALKWPVHEVVSRGKEQILRPLQRTLRQLSFPTQVGYVDAVTFCLELEKPLLVEELFRSPVRDNFLNGVVDLSEDPTIEKLTEAEEGIRHKLVENKLIQTMIVEHLTALKRCAMDFLCCITFKCPHLLREPNNDILFRRIISVFFKNIQSRDKQVVEFAKQGLKQAIAQHPKPKEPLQTNLRPVLQTLAEYTKLTIPYLQGFSRVLELLSHWFNVQLGEKLLEHLARWTEPEKLAQAKRWAPGTESLVGAAILDLFHLLPAAASKFLVPIVAMVLRLEAVLTVAGPGVAHLGLRGPGAASTSPYREPLLRFCNKHAPTAVVYFLNHLRDPQRRRLFLILLRADAARELRVELGSNVERLLDATFKSQENASSDGLYTFCGVEIVDAISLHDSEWLSKNRTVLDSLVSYWNSSERLLRIEREQSLSLEHIREPRIIANCFLRHCRDHPKDFELLFHVLQVFSIRTLNDFTFVKEFFADVVAKDFADESKRGIMNFFLNFFGSSSTTQERKVHALQYLILPMLQEHLQRRDAGQSNDRGGVHLDRVSAAAVLRSKHPLDPDHDQSLMTNRQTVPTVNREVKQDTVSVALGGIGSSVQGDSAALRKSGAAISLGSLNVADTSRRQMEDLLGSDRTAPTSTVPDLVLDDVILQRVMKDLLDQPDDVLRRYDEPLSAKLLQLATILVRYMPAELGRYRKELIKFGWNHLKREDSVAKQWAFVNVSRFFEAYQAPDKIILQVYVALLRTCQPEGKHLVRQALDILTPALPKRLLHNISDHKYPIWIRYTKKILLEEGHSLLHLVHIWQLIVRHADLFYSARALFVPIMVTSLTRIGLGPTTTAENRRLALDLADLIISWELKRLRFCSNEQTNPAEGSLSLGLKRSRDEATEIGGNEHAVVSHLVPGERDVALGIINPDAAHERPSKLLKTEDGSAKPSLPARGGNASSEIARGGVYSTQTSGLGLTTHPPTGVRPVDTVNANPTLTGRDSDDFRPTPSMADVVVNFLAQAAFRPMDRRESRVITRRCINLISSALSVWPETPVRMAFLEKHLELGAGDRSALMQGHAGRSKNTAPPSGPGSATESKRGLGSGGGVSRIEKFDGQSPDRSLALANVLSVAVDLSLVVLERQGVKFVAVNAGSIRAVIAPSLALRNISSASQFSELLSRLLKLCPLARARLQGQNPTMTRPIGAVVVSPASSSARNSKNSGSNDVGYASALSNSVPLQVAGASAGGTPQTSAPPSGLNLIRPRAMSSASHAPVLDVPNSAVRDTEVDAAIAASFNSVYSLVEATIERCLKASDVASMHCGFLALRALVESAAEEFLKYQDLVIKALHRVAKESLQMPQPSNTGQTAGTAGSVATLGGVSKDRAVGSGAQAGGPVTGHQSRTDGEGSQSASGALLGGSTKGIDNSGDSQALILGLSLLASNVAALEPQQRRSFFQVLSVLIDRCVQVKVLLEIVRIVESWIRWKAPSPESGSLHSTSLAKEPLGPKEKVTFLLKMCVFERVTGQGSEQLMEAYLDIVLRVFGGGDGSERRPELLQRLERAFMIGLKSPIASVRSRFFALFHAAADPSPTERLRYVLAKQDWEPLADSFWIKQALELLLAVVDPGKPIMSDQGNASLPRLRLRGLGVRLLSASSDQGIFSEREVVASGNPSRMLRRGIQPVTNFIRAAHQLHSGDLVLSLRSLLNVDAELAHAIWVRVFPRTWSLIPENERCSVEDAIRLVFAKEYHAVQMSWPHNVIQALLEGVSRCEPIPSIPPELLQHLGSRFNSWHIVLPLLENRRYDLQELLMSGRIDDAKVIMMSEAELESTLDAIAALYRELNDFDMFSGSWKLRARLLASSAALCLEQQGLYTDAQMTYSSAILKHEAAIQFGGAWKVDAGCSRAFGLKFDAGNSGPVRKAEICLWEERWISCARELCQWGVLTEFSRSCVHTDLLHDCLWRVGDWSALKELLLKHPVEEGPQLKLYQAYGQLQENKLDSADVSIQQGMQRSLEKYYGLPGEFGSLSRAPVLLQFQQLVELQESSKIMGELNALSRHGAGNTNIEQRIENLRLILHTWRERLPGQTESLAIWGGILTWRNHVHHIVVNVLEALKEAANQTVQAASAQTSSGIVAGTVGGAGVVQGSLASAVQPSFVQAAAAIAAALSQQPNLVMGVNETAWSVNRFARASRKQGRPDVALKILHKLYPFGTMELNEYFFKTKESAKANLARPSGLTNSLVQGLNELNRCNMDLFSAQQKAELFTLKGRFLAHLGGDDDVADAYSTALSLSSDVGSTWLAWARHSDAIHEKCAPSNDESTLPTSDAGNPGPRQSSQLIWREAAVNCYLQAVQYGSRKARMYIPRALRLLTLDVAARKNLKSAENSTGELHSEGVPSLATGAASSLGGLPGFPNGSRSSFDNQSRTSRNEGVHGVFLAFIETLPPWIWLPWLAQLIPMLARAEVFAARAILVKIAQIYPQALFFPLRGFLEERKSLDSPTRSILGDALRTNRPNTPALLPAAASQQYTNATKAVNVAHANAEQARRRYASAQGEYTKAVELAQSKVGATEHDALAAGAEQLKEPLVNAQKAFERAMVSYQNAVAQRKLAQPQMESADQGSQRLSAVLGRSVSGVEDVGSAGRSQQPVGNVTQISHPVGSEGAHFASQLHPRSDGSSRENNHSLSKPVLKFQAPTSVSGASLGVASIPPGAGDCHLLKAKELFTSEFKQVPASETPVPVAISAESSAAQAEREIAGTAGIASQQSVASQPSPLLVPEALPGTGEQDVTMTDAHAYSKLDNVVDSVLAASGKKESRQASLSSRPAAASSSTSSAAFLVNPLGPSSAPTVQPDSAKSLTTSEAAVAGGSVQTVLPPRAALTSPASDGPAVGIVTQSVSTNAKALSSSVRVTLADAAAAFSEGSTSRREQVPALTEPVLIHGAVTPAPPSGKGMAEGFDNVLNSGLQTSESPVLRSAVSTGNEVGVAESGGSQGKSPGAAVRDIPSEQVQSVASEGQNLNASPARHVQNLQGVQETPGKETPPREEPHPALSRVRATQPDSGDFAVGSNQLPNTEQDRMADAQDTTTTPSSPKPKISETPVTLPVDRETHIADCSMMVSGDEGTEGHDDNARPQVEPVNPVKKSESDQKSVDTTNFSPRPVDGSEGALKVGTPPHKDEGGKELSHLKQQTPPTASPLMPVDCRSKGQTQLQAREKVQADSAKPDTKSQAEVERLPANARPLVEAPTQHHLQVHFQTNPDLQSQSANLSQPHLSNERQLKTATQTQPPVRPELQTGTHSRPPGNGVQCKLVHQAITSAQADEKQSIMTVSQVDSLEAPPASGAYISEEPVAGSQGPLLNRELIEQSASESGQAQHAQPLLQSGAQEQKSTPTADLASVTQASPESETLQQVVGDVRTFPSMQSSTQHGLDGGTLSCSVLQNRGHPTESANAQDHGLGEAKRLQQDQADRQTPAQGLDVALVAEGLKAQGLKQMNDAIPQSQEQASSVAQVRLPVDAETGSGSQTPSQAQKDAQEPARARTALWTSTDSASAAIGPGQMIALPHGLTHVPGVAQVQTLSPASRQAQADPPAEAQAQAQPQPKSLTQDHEQTEARTQAQYHTQAKALARAEVQARAQIQEQRQTQEQTRTQRQTDDKAKHQGQAPTQIQGRAQERINVRTQAHAEAQTQAQPQPQTQIQTQPQPQGQAQQQTQPHAQAHVHTQAQAQAQRQGLAHARAVGQTQAPAQQMRHQAQPRGIAHTPSQMVARGQARFPQVKGESQLDNDDKALSRFRETTTPQAPDVHSVSPNSHPTTVSRANIHAPLRSHTEQQRSSSSPRTPYEHADWVMAHLVTAHQPLYIEMEGIAQDLSHRMKPQQEEQLLGLMNALLHRCYQLSVQANKEVAPSLRSALEEVSRMCFGTTSPSNAPGGSSSQTPRGGGIGVKIQPSIADLKVAFEAELAPQTASDFPTRIEPFIARLRRWKNIFQRRVDAMPEYQRLELLSRRLIELHNSDIEVFGQYLAAEAKEPSPDTHVKIGRFAADTRVIRRHSGAARGVTIFGTDGKTYHFMLETSANAACQPTEERAAQICRLLNASFFAKNAEASCRRVHVEVPVLIPTGQHTRLVSDDPMFSSLAEGLERFMESRGGNIDDPLMAFRNLAAESYSRRHLQNPQQAPGRKDSIAARVEAYHAVCESHVPDTCLSAWISAASPSANALYALRRNFAQTLGTASLVSYALAVGARRPQNIMFSWSTGAVSNLHMRPLLSQRGLLECDEAVPFRLTRNIERFLGPTGVQGPLFGSMAVTMRALRSNDELLRVYLNSIVRDELSTWTGSRSEGSSAGGGGAPAGPGVAGSSAGAPGATGPAAAASGNEGGLSSPSAVADEFDHLESRLAESVDNMMTRFGPRLDRDAGSGSGSGSGGGGVGGVVELDSVSRTVYELIERAGLPEHLAQMDSSWQAWF